MVVSVHTTQASSDLVVQLANYRLSFSRALVNSWKFLLIFRRLWWVHRLVVFYDGILLSTVDFAEMLAGFESTVYVCIREPWRLGLELPVLVKLGECNVMIQVRIFWIVEQRVVVGVQDGIENSFQVNPVHWVVSHRKAQQQCVVGFPATVGSF